MQDELDQLWQSDQALAQPIRGIVQISGVSPQTILEVVAETNGFVLNKKRNQLASHGGLYVVLDESGNHRGNLNIQVGYNPHLRRVLYIIHARRMCQPTQPDTAGFLSTAG